MATDKPVMDIVVRLEAVPKDGLPIHIEADAAAREALAARYDLLAVKRFCADLRVSRWRKQGLTLRGDLMASVEQRCVVTLAPVVSDICEAVEARFDPAPETAPVGVDEDPPEPMHQMTAQLGGILEEFFALGLDPYPRAEGAMLPAGYEDGEGGQDGAGENPFAAIAVLKSRDP